MIIFTPNVRDTVVACKRSTLLANLNVASFGVGSACKQFVSTVYLYNKDGFQNILADHIWTKVWSLWSTVFTTKLCLTISNFHSYFQLYLEEKQENDKLRKEVKRISQELTDTKLDLEKARMKQDSSRSYDSSAERRVYYSPYSSQHDYSVNGFNYRHFTYP